MSEPLSGRDLARSVLETEAAAIAALVDRLGDSFDRAVLLVAGCRGRVIVTGMGKSGIISRKIAATLTSTASRAPLVSSSLQRVSDCQVVSGGSSPGSR